MICSSPAKPVDYTMVRYILFMNEARRKGDYETLYTLCKLAERKFTRRGVSVIERALDAL